MKPFGVREICDVVLKAKAAQKIGNKIFYANEPVIYFDTLKTSSLEGAATTVYAQGGKGNARLIAWEGERTITYTMEDALLSPESFMILSGAGLIEGSETKPVYQHVTERVDSSLITKTESTIKVQLSKKPYLPVAGDNTIGVSGNYAYVMLVKDGQIVSEPYIPVHGDSGIVEVKGGEDGDGEVIGYTIEVATHGIYDDAAANGESYKLEGDMLETANSFDSVIVDYYVEHKDGSAKQIEITADKFGGNYYLEASTLFRDTDGVDLPAEFIIPNCKIQSNFTFTMASSGDPSELKRLAA